MLHAIERMSDLEINEVISALIRRYRICYPEEEVIFLSLPKTNPQEREIQGKAIIDCVEQPYRKK